MRLLVCGGRHFDDAEMIHRELAQIHARQPVSALIHGSATGLGVAAELWARRNGVHVVRYPANWEFYGKKAEGVRNAFMIEDSRPGLVLAFRGGRHTADLIRRASAAGIQVIAVPSESEDGAADDESEGDSCNGEVLSMFI